MKKLLNSPQFVILGMLFIVLAIIFAINPNASAQEKPKPDSITVYQFTVHPQSFKTATQILSDKFLKNGSVSDTVLLNSALQMLFSNGKQVKIWNPEKEKKVINSPKNK